jgi:hypothetical protein
VSEGVTTAERVSSESRWISSADMLHVAIYTTAFYVYARVRAHNLRYHLQGVRGSRGRGGGGRVYSRSTAVSWRAVAGRAASRSRKVARKKRKRASDL